MPIANGPASTYLYGNDSLVGCELYTIGGSLVLTTNHVALLGGTVAVIKRGSFRTSLGLQVDSVDVTIANGSLTFGGKALATAALDGDLDGKSFVAERVLNGSTRVVRFTGTVHQVEPRTMETRIIAKSFMAGLDVPIPSRKLRTNCPYVFKSPACGYAGGTTTCAKTPVACVALGNRTRYGGFPLVPKAPGEG